MTLRVSFHNGPADGVVHDYTSLNTALPSLYWRNADDADGYIYHRAGNSEDPITGAWLYEAAPEHGPRRPPPDNR